MKHQIDSKELDRRAPELASRVVERYVRTRRPSEDGEPSTRSEWQAVTAEQIRHLAEAQRRKAPQIFVDNVRSAAGARWPNRGITISAGCASLREDDEHPESLINRADKALYAAKETGRKRVMHFHDI